MGYVKTPMKMGETLYLPLDKTMREFHNITKGCIVEFEILSVKPPTTTQTNDSEKKDEPTSETTQE